MTKGFKGQTFEVRDEHLTMSEMSKKYGISQPTLFRRINRGLRGEDLLQKTLKTIEFKGEQVPLYELTKKYKVDRATIMKRYNQGYRDDDLVSKASALKNTTYYIDGKPFRLTARENAQRVRNKLNTFEVQSRLDIGFSIKDALSFSFRYVTKFGQLCYEFSDNEFYYYIPYDDIEDLNKAGITVRRIGRRLGIGYDISEMVLSTTRVFEESIIESNSVDEELESINRKKNVDYYKDLKYREQKPHLYNGTPQTHGFGDYAQYLADGYTFKCSEVSKNEGCTV